MTFSIVGFDDLSGDVGVAVASRFLAVGSVVPLADASVGAIATQAWANVAYGPDGLALLARGIAPQDVVERLTADDPGRSERQVGVVDRAGRSAAHTGEQCMPWAGHRTTRGASIQGNILAGPDVVEAMLASWLGSDGLGSSLADRLLDALAAGDRAGGDRRGRQSAALLVVREGGGYGGGNDRLLDLRVDDHQDPLSELRRIRALHRLYWDRPAVADLVAIDEELAGELVDLLRSVDGLPDSVRGQVSAPPDLERGSGIGEARVPPSSWDLRAEQRLAAWMAVENLEERTAARGWIDPEVLLHLRGATR